MRRAVVMIALLIAAAAVAQAAIAYALALRSWEITDDPWPQQLLMEGWPGPVPPEWKQDSGGIIVHPQRFSSMSSAAWDWQSLHGLGGLTRLELNMWRVGWPFRSLGAYRHVRIFPNVRGTSNVVQWRTPWVQAWMNGYVQPPAKPGDGPRVWPLYPIWSGFALNTLIFAAVPAGVWWAAGWARRSRRRKLGLCKKCGYELAGLAKCPECGLQCGMPQLANGQRSK